MSTRTPYARWEGTIKLSARLRQGMGQPPGRLLERGAEGPQNRASQTLTGGVVVLSVSRRRRGYDLSMPRQYICRN